MVGLSVSTGPLAGVKVIELAGIGPSPFACMLLADMGADVLRLERGNPDAEKVVSADTLNRSRPSVAVNLKSDAGRELVLRLSEQADVLIEGFRPGVAERLGVGPTDVHARNARLVYGRMTGFGQTGPLAQRAGHDINYIAVAGTLWPLGRAGERPVPPMNLVGDFGGGSLYLVVGILAALWHARESGEGQVIDAAMVDGAASLASMLYSFRNMGFWRDERGVNLLDTGAPFYDVYETSDGGFMAVGAIEGPFYALLLEGLGLSGEDLPRQMDREGWPHLRSRFTEVFATKTRDEWTAIFEGVDACVTPVLSPSEAPTHPYNAQRHVFSTGDAPVPNPAPRFSNTPSMVTAPAYAPGSGTREGLSAWGLSAEEIATLQAAGAFA